MLTSEFKSKFLPILKNKVKVKEYNSKGYSKRWGNLSVHDKEFDPNEFNFIDIDGDVFHINYQSEVELTKTTPSGKMYGVIHGINLVPISLEYLKPFMEFQELEAPIQETQTLNESTYVWEMPKRNLDAEFKTADSNTTSVSNQIQQFFTALTDKFAAKSKEYSTDSWDSNFVKGARVLGTSKEQALLGYATKHLVSIMDISEGKSYTKEEIDEKFGDLIVYFSLLRVMLLEKVK